MVCNIAFAISTEKKANLSLDLGGKESIVHAGFLSSLPAEFAVTKITSSEPAYTTPITITIDPTGTGEFQTKATTFYVYWYLHAIKGTTNSNLSLSFSSLVGGITEKEYLGYTVSYDNTTTYEGNNVPPSVAGSASVTNVADAKGAITLFETTGKTGLSRGYMAFTIDPITYSQVTPQAYTGTMSLTITAP